MFFEDPFEPIGDCSLVRYVQIRRELVRAGHRAPSVITCHRLTTEQWDEIDRGWSSRIRDSDAVRAAFRELYARDRVIAAHDTAPCGANHVALSGEEHGGHQGQPAPGKETSPCRPSAASWDVRR